MKQNLSRITNILIVLSLLFNGLPVHTASAETIDTAVSANRQVTNVQVTNTGFHSLSWLRNSKTLLAPNVYVKNIASIVSVPPTSVLIPAQDVGILTTIDQSFVVKIQNKDIEPVRLTVQAKNAILYPPLEMGSAGIDYQLDVAQGTFLNKSLDSIHIFNVTGKYSDVDISGLDENTLAFYLFDEKKSTWLKLPTTVDTKNNQLYAETDRGGRIAAFGKLNVYSIQEPGNFKLVLDPDNDTGWVIWPNYGKVTELPYNLALAKGIQEKLLVDGCTVDVRLTRESTTPSQLSRDTRAQMAVDFNAEMFITLAFNTVYGYSWGYSGDGGVEAWARNSHPDDDALANEFFTQIKAYTGRPHRKPILHPSKYAEFNDLPTNITYAHIEALFLDHNYDWPIINTNFSLIEDAAYTAIRKQLESRGVTCVGENGKVSPYPTPPTAEMLQRLNDLGYQNSQRYGADPVSFSTGNHIIRRDLFSLPGQGGFGFDFTLIYNSQDTRSGFFGTGWSAPISYVQRYSDDSASLTFNDGHAFYFPLVGNGYDTPEDFHGDFIRTDTGWTLTEIDGTKSIFQETETGLGLLISTQERHGNTVTYEYDLSNQIRPFLKNIIDTAGRKFTFASNEDGYVTQISLPDGRVFGFEYTDGNLTKVVDAKGGTYQYEYDGRNRIVKEWDPEGILFLQVEYDDRDRVIRQLDAGGTELHLEYGDGVTKYFDNLGNLTEYHFDDQNRVTRVVDALGFNTQYEYDEQDNLTRYTDERGNVFEYGYDAQSNLISEKGPDGYFASYTYNNFGDLISVTDKGGNNGELRTTKLQVNAQGNIEQIIYPDSSNVQFTYDPFGNIQSLEDQNGQVTSFSYNEQGLLIKQSNPLGYITQYEYDLSGRMLAMTDANSHSVKLEYDANDNVLKIIDPKGSLSIFEYDKNDNLVTMTDRRNGAWSFTYDDDLKLTSETDPEGHTTRYQYDLAYNLTSVTDPAGNITRYGYNKRYDLVKETTASGAISQFNYDPSGNLSEVIDALGQHTFFEYNSLNLLVAQTDALGGRTKLSYDSIGRLIQETNPRGAKTVYSYDLLDRPVQIQDALDGIWKFEYDAAGNLLSITDANENITRMEYDQAGQLVTSWDADGNQTRFIIDRVGNLEKITNALDATTLFKYDENDNLIQVTDALGYPTGFSYDAEDNLVETRDTLGNSTRFEYNLDGLMTKMIEAGGQTSIFAYDPAHNLSGFTNAKGNSWSFAYDKLNQRIQEKDPLGNVTKYGYDLLGRMIRVTDANGIATGYDYDALDNLIAVTQNASQDGSNAFINVLTQYGYDEVGNLTSITDANDHTASFTYDLLNRVIREHNALGDQWQYGYDPAGNLTSRVDANGNKTEYAYTANDLLERVTYPDRTFIAYTYDSIGNQVKAEASWLGAITNTYDAIGHLTSSIDHTGKTVQYGYDAAGNQTKITYPDGKSAQYGYDATNYLNQVIDPEGNTFQIIRDATHNTARVEYPNNTLAVYRYDAAERLVSITNLHADNTLLDKTIYLLDAVGNRIQKDSTYVIGQGKPFRTVSQYTYDPLYRLINSSDSAGTHSAYTYDAVGNRTSLTTNMDPFIGRQRETLDYQYVYNEINALTGIELTSTWRDVSSIKTHMSAFINDVQAQSGKGINADTANELIKSATAIVDQINGGITNQQKLETALAGLSQQVQNTFEQGKIKNAGVANGLQAKIVDGKSANNNSKSNASQSYTYTYDKNGNRVERIMPDLQGSDGWVRTAYAYDFENRLIGTQDFRVNNPNSNQNGNPGAESQMTFDAYGRLFERNYDQHAGSGGIQTTQFAYNGLDPIVEYAGPSNQYTNYYRGDGRILSMLTNAGANYSAGRAEYFHYDGLNSVTTLTKQDGQSAHGYSYSDFGTILDNNGRAQDASNFTDPHNHYTYTGQEWNEDNGLYHFYAREYDPFTGTWLQQDPYRGKLNAPRELHRYEYVSNNPTNYVDHLGFDRTSASTSQITTPNSKVSNLADTRGHGNNQCPASGYCNTLTADPYETSNTQISTPRVQQAPNYGSYLTSYGIGLATAVYESSFKAYWEYYGYVNRISVSRTKPIFSIYSRSLPGVKSKVAAKLAQVETPGNFIKINAPKWNSVSSLIAVALVVRDGYSQYDSDRSRMNLDNYQKVGRVSLSIAASSFNAAGSIATATLVGTAIGGPVGTVAGFLVGSALALGGQHLWDSKKSNVFNTFGFGK